MKKLILSVLTFILALSSISFANCIGDISQIRNAKCITEYPANAKYDDFDTVTFGKCEHPILRFKYENGIIKDNRFSEKKEVTTINSIEWFVLEKQGDKALLLSKYELVEVDCEDEIIVSPWDKSFIKKFLNNTFKNKSFNSNEQKNLIDINNSGGIFILSYDEACKFFGIDSQLSNEQYIYFKSNAVKCELYMLYWDNKVRNSKCLYYDLRAITAHSSSIGIDENGKYYVYRYNVEQKAEPNKIYKDKPLTSFHLRPAMWVSLSDNSNQNSRNTNNFATQQNNAEKDANVIAGLPSVQSEYRDDGHFYLNNNMQKSTWVYYVTYYYHVDGAGNIEKSKWIEQRYVGADGRMYRGRQTPDGNWVGDDGLVVNVSQDLSHSLTIEAAEPDSWYKTQSGLWYYFENDRTTTKKGWFTDARDNQTYYLDPSTGIMAVGWTTINGSEYYFNESHDNVNNWYETGGGFYESYGKKTKAYGSMFRNEKTPDGYQVDGNGKMIN